jgi:hypothetical protein
MLKRFIVLALAVMAFAAPVLTSVGVASADYTMPDQPEQAP